MGNGALSKARASDDGAMELFKALDSNGDEWITTTEMYDFMQARSEQIQAYWDLPRIKETVAKYAKADERGIKINYEEFRCALQDMEETAPKRVTLSGPSGRRFTLKRAWTWRKLPANKFQAAILQVHERQQAQAAAEAAGGGGDDDLLAPPKPPETTALAQQHDAYWATQDEEHAGCWVVPLGRDLARMPWLKQSADEGETCLDSAIARARSLEKTPLLLDSAQATHVDELYTSRGAVVLDASVMLSDERAQKRTHEQVMRDSREALIVAMREGRTLYIRLERTVTDFSGDQYCSDDAFPFSVFDQRVVAQLAPFTGAVAAQRYEADVHGVWHGLWGSEHPFASVLREKDRDPLGRFTVGDGFAVVVSTQKEKKDFKEALSSSLPLLRLQPIQPMPTAGRSS